jgi:hypothetical protein
LVRVLWLEEVGLGLIVLLPLLRCSTIMLLIGWVVVLIPSFLILTSIWMWLLMVIIRWCMLAAQVRRAIMPQILILFTRA